MKCRTVEENLLGYVDSELPGMFSREITSHITECVACQKLVNDEEKIRTVLRDMPVKAMRANFRNRVLDSVKEHQTPKKQYGFFAGFSAAMAASVMIWVVAAYVGAPTNGALPAVQPVVLALNEVKHVKLAFEAPADFDEVTLTIELPKHVELDGFEGESLISWQTSLHSGKNVLALPLIVKDAIKGEIVATVSNSKTSKVFKVPLATLIHEAQNMNQKITLS